MPTDEKRDEFEEALKSMPHRVGCSLKFDAMSGMCSCNVNGLVARLRALRGIPRADVLDMLIRAVYWADNDTEAKKASHTIADAILKEWEDARKP